MEHLTPAVATPEIVDLLNYLDFPFNAFGDSVSTFRFGDLKFVQPNDKAECRFFPSFEVVRKWLEQEYNLLIILDFEIHSEMSGDFQSYSFRFCDISNSRYFKLIEDGYKNFCSHYWSYDECLSAAIESACEYLKKKDMEESDIIG